MRVKRKVFIIVLVLTLLLGTVNVFSDGVFTWNLTDECIDANFYGRVSYMTVRWPGKDKITLYAHLSGSEKVNVTSANAGVLKFTKTSGRLLREYYTFYGQEYNTVQFSENLSAVIAKVYFYDNTTWKYLE